MTNQMRKHIRPLPLVVSLAIIGALAALIVLANDPGALMAHGGGDDHQASCDAMTDAEREEHNSEALLNQTTLCEPPNRPPALTGVTLDAVSLRVPALSDPIDVSVAFSDPDGDTLTYDSTSNKPNVATASFNGNMMTIASGSVRGTAVITIIASDGSVHTVSTTVEVTVSEGYTLEAEPIRDAANRATYVVQNLGPYTAKFNLGVGGSMDDVTVTVTASEPDNGGITITDSDGLIGAGFNQDNDLEGSLTVKATDQGSRAFEIEGVCEVEGAVAAILVEDKDLDTVAEGSILCEKPAVVVPDDRDDVSDTFTVASYGDWEYHDVTDGFILEASNGNDHMVNLHYSKKGLLSRDEPVIHAEYTLGVSDVETLASLPGGLPRRAIDDDTLTRKERNADVEEGQRTIEVLVGQEHVQLTVTSMKAGPAYIRFLDSYNRPFGTDVDEEPMWRGADVVGLDSQGRLALNIEMDLSAAKALAFDQYVITTPGDPTRNSYLTGAAGTYNQGAFRFFNPCPMELGVDHEFYVQVYEATGKYRETTEKIDCVASPKPGPAGLVFEIDSQKPGEGRLRFEPALNAVGHSVLLIDASNRNIVETVDPAVSPVTFDNLNNGWTYHIVVIAEGAANQYTADAVKDYGVRWLGVGDVPLSTAPSAEPTRMHPLCQVDNADITALLSDCDTNTAPMPVGSVAAQTVTAGESVSVDVAANFSDADMDDTLIYTAMSDMTAYATVSVSGSTVTITGVAAGSATITVTATDSMGQSAMQTIMVTVEAATVDLQKPVVKAVNPVGSGIVLVSWDTVEGATGYSLIASNLTNRDEATLTAAADADDVSGQIQGLTPGDEYLIFVGAFNENLEFALAADYVKVTAE